MSTNKKIDVYKDFSFRVRSRANGYYDFNDLYVLNENGNINIEQTPYDGATLAYIEGVNSASCVNVNITSLPDYSRYLGENTFCLMQEGQNYKDVALLELNPYFINNGCSIEDGIATKTSSNSILINRNIGKYSSLIATVKCQFNSASSHMAVMSDSSSTEEDFGIRSNGKFSFYKGGWIDGVSTVQANTWYYLRIIIENNTTTYYSLLDNNYTYSTLPTLENWTLECSINSNLFMQDSLLYLGYDHNTTGESLAGKIDLNNSKVIIDNNIFWEYPQYAPIKYNFDGCLHNYTDNGSAANLECYCLVKDDKTEQKLILTQDNSVQITGYDSMYLGTLSVPAHDTYNYNEQTVPTFETVNLVGNLKLNTTTGVLSNYAANNYATLPNIFYPENDTWEFCVKVVPTSFSSSCRAYCLGGSEYGYAALSLVNNKTRYWISGTGNSWDIASSKNGTITLSANTTYWIRLKYTGTQYISEISEDGEVWVEDLVITNSNPVKAGTATNLRLGTAESPSSQYFYGTICLDGCYLKQDNTVIWSGLGSKQIGIWTKK